MWYPKVFRRLLWFTPIVIFIVSIALCGYAWYTQHDILLEEAVNGLVLYAPSSAVIFWGMIYELDESRKVMQLQKQRLQKNEG